MNTPASIAITRVLVADLLAEPPDGLIERRGFPAAIPIHPMTPENAMHTTMNSPAGGIWTVQPFRTPRRTRCRTRSTRHRSPSRSPREG